MRTPSLILVLLLLCGSFLAEAQAQPAAGFALDRFQAAPTTEDGLWLVLPRTLGHLRPGAALTLDYAHQPLVLSEAGASAEGAIVKHRMVGHLVAALGLGERFELFVHAPITMVQRGDGPRLGGVAFPDPSKLAFGDLSLGGSLRLLGDDLSAFQLGVTAAVTTPTGGDSSLSSDDGVSANGRLSAAYHLARWTVAANLGGRYRPSADYGSARIGSELLFGVGTYLRATETLILMGELYGATAFRDSQAFTSRGTPAELMFGARWSTPVKLVLTTGVGLGLTQAVGVPDVRALLGLGFPPPRPPLAPPDRDKDGILDDADRCPDVPEDHDDFQDDDGCPDPDNDRDGLLDADDQCPMAAEDMDGFEDEDGCPESDNDQDGIPDASDKCPNHAEDKDGFEDEDGCPDLDNDQDGIPDERDQCPAEPEDLDGFEDEDGCPDPDNDQDGVPDERDNCPTVPGPEHTKGCPSAVRIDRSQIRILERIEFETNRAEIRAESLGILDQVRSALEVNPQIRKVRVEGHTDSRGPNERNLQLSQRRAEAVMKYLIAEGISESRLEAKGWGEERPLVPNNGPDNWQTNRRVEFHIVDPAPTEEDAPGPGALDVQEGTEEDEDPNWGGAL